MKKLVLVGGGHAQLAVLQALARQRAAHLDVVLVTPSPWQYYSGMLPGFIAGHYAEADCRIDLRPLAKAAGVRLQLGQAVELAADERQLRLAEGSGLDYDLLSLDPGSATDLDTLAPPKRRAEVFALLRTANAVGVIVVSAVMTAVSISTSLITVSCMMATVVIVVGIASRRS